MKVALLNPVFWPEVRRGSERFARELADGLLSRGHSVRLITSKPGLPSRAVEQGLEVVRTWRPPDGRLRRRLFEDHLTHVPFSYRALLGGDDDIAHALYPTDALAAARWRRQTGRPAILSYMGIPHRRSLADRRWRIAVLTRAIEGTNVVTTLSEAADRGFQRWLGLKTRVIRPGVDLEAFSPGGERTEAPTVFFPGSLEDPRKRAGLLLEAFSVLRRQRPDATLVLSGSGRANGKLAGDGVQFVDVDDRNRLADAYRRAWVTVLPSHDEAFGLVLVESLACGTPVVGSRSGGIPEVVTSEGIGRLFDGDEPGPLAAVLADAFELATDRSTAGACRARAEDFRIERAVDEYEALYRELLASAHA